MLVFMSESATYEPRRLGSDWTHLLVFAGMLKFLDRREYDGLRGSCEMDKMVSLGYLEKRRKFSFRRDPFRKHYVLTERGCKLVEAMKKKVEIASRDLAEFMKSEGLEYSWLE